MATTNENVTRSGELKASDPREGCETAHLMLPAGEDPIKGWRSLPVDIKHSILGLLKLTLMPLLILMTTALHALTSIPMVGANLAPEVAPDQRTIPAAGKFEKFSTFAFGVVAAITALFTIVGVVVSIIEFRRRWRTNGALAGPPAGEALRREGRMLQTPAVRRWSTSDILHYEHVQKFEEVV